MNDLNKVRKELIATRITAFGLFLVVVLSLLGMSRVVVLSALFAVVVVMVFLGCRWGLTGENELSLAGSISVALGVAALYSLLMLWVATR